MIQTGRASDLDVARLPRITGWGRPDAKVPPSWCAVIDADRGGSVLTACAGRWPAWESWSFLLDRDRDTDATGAKLDKCGACDDLAKRQRTLEHLAELRHAPMIATRELIVGFDPAYPAATVARDSRLDDFDVSDTDAEPPLTAFAHEARCFACGRVVHAGAPARVFEEGVVHGDGCPEVEA